MLPIKLLTDWSIAKLIFIIDLFKIQDTNPTDLLSSSLVDDIFEKKLEEQQIFFF